MLAELVSVDEGIADAYAASLVRDAESALQRCGRAGRDAVGARTLQMVVSFSPDGRVTRALARRPTERQRAAAACASSALRRLTIRPPGRAFRLQLGVTWIREEDRLDPGPILEEDLPRARAPR